MLLGLLKTNSSGEWFPESETTATLFYQEVVFSSYLINFCARLNLDFFFVSWYCPGSKFLFLCLRNGPWLWVEMGRYIALLCVSVGCYLASFVFSGFLFHWFTPSGEECELNTFVIAFTLILGVSFAIVSLHPQVWMSNSYASLFSEVRWSDMFFHKVAGSDIGSQFVFGR